MRKMKHLLSLLLATSLTVTAFTGCGGGGDDTPAANNGGGNDSAEADNQGGGDTADDTSSEGLPPLTEDEIELTYLNFDSDETTQQLANKFMELHPNIKVTSQFVEVGDYGDTLLNLVSAGNTPDCFMYSDCDFALHNQLLKDITQYWEADPENENLLPTINELKLGYYFSGQKWGTPIKFFPGVIFVDMQVIETLNLEMPPMDWTWSDLIDLIKAGTDLNQNPAYYGLGVYNRLDSYYGIAAGQDVIGEFGFNGKTFNLGIWAVGEQEFSDLKLNGYVAPDTQTPGMEAWLGDYEGWHGSSGRVAVSSEAYWTFKNIWDTKDYRDLGMKFVPYVIPSVEEGEGVHNSIGTLDFGGVSAATEHPREAYELLKFMGWGVDGWSARLDMYEDETVTDANGNPLSRATMPAPITMDQGIWDRYRQLFPIDDVEGPYWDTYFESCTRPIPFGWMEIPGYWAFCDGYFNSIGIHNLVDTGQAKAVDYADEATEQANQYFAEAMEEYFQIDVTSDDYTFERDTTGNTDAKLSFS